MKVAELLSAQQHPVFEQIGGMGPLSALRNYDCLIPKILEVKRKKMDVKIEEDEKEEQKNTKDAKDRSRNWQRNEKKRCDCKEKNEGLQL